MRSIGTKPLAFDKNSREPVWAHNAEPHTPYWYPDADCFRHRGVKGDYYFQFAPGSAAGAGGGRETVVHELAKLLIVEHRRMAATTPEGIFYVSFSSALSEEAWDHLRPDVTGVVEECFPRLIPSGSLLHVEVHVTNPVDPEKKRRMLMWGQPVIEIDLPTHIEPFLNVPVSSDHAVLLLKRRVFRELIACPLGRWIAGP